LQLSGALRWQPMKKIMFKTDLFAWRGARFLKNPANNEDRLPSVVDLNAGIEFRVTNSISVWTQFNNIFNQTYQRWNNYQQLGFQFFGGIRFTFDQKL
jgi:outer membrane receptor protein involved in Fe transport